MTKARLGVRAACPPRPTPLAGRRRRVVTTAGRRSRWWPPCRRHRTPDKQHRSTTTRTGPTTQPRPRSSPRSQRPHHSERAKTRKTHQIAGANLDDVGDGEEHRQPGRSPHGERREQRRRPRHPGPQGDPARRTGPQHHDGEQPVGPSQHQHVLGRPTTTFADPGATAHSPGRLPC